MKLSLLLTKRCNAQCAHCATDSGPYARRSLPTQKVFSIMNEAAQRRRAGESLMFGLSGGEAFLDLEQLVAVIAHGVGLGATVTCVTNAYWATSDAKAQSIVARVRAAGLTHLAASTSRYHQRFVPIERVKRALSTARAAGINTLLKIVYSAPEEQEGVVQRWADFVGADALQAFPVVPYLRQGGELPLEHYVRAPGLPKGRCPAAVLTIREDGAAFNCCTPGGFETLLKLGNVFDHSLDALVDRYHFDPTFQVLREQGPIHFARHAIKNGEEGRLRSAYADVCDLCAHIASDPVLTKLAQDSARTYRRRWAMRIAKTMRANATLITRKSTSQRLTKSRGIEHER
ncbi:MAG: radical SAM protein [Steroidobacteraceae bacterium]|jgi:MoaA/NifB/PqqE/SkfB family radical SAM enzyme